MKNGSTTNQVDILRLLPSIDVILRSKAAEKIVKECGAKHLTMLARTISDTLRQEILQKANTDTISREDLLKESERRLEKAWADEQNSSLQRVINATGVVIHTNLGRAPLSENAQKAVADEAARYCSLEYDLETGNAESAAEASKTCSPN